MPKKKKAKKSKRIVVVGSANVDLTSFTDRFPRPGETIFGDRFDLGFGGKGANQAAAAALCGARTDMVARVGDDLFGPATIENFRSFGIGTKHVRTVKNTSSGVAPIFVDSSGQNRIVVVKGANDRLDRHAIQDAERLLRRADVIVLQFEIPLDTVYHTIGLAEKLGVPVILNPAPALSLDFEKIRSVAYFVPNETEAASVTGGRVKTLAEAKSAAEALRSRGLSRVIVTLGKRGAVVATPDGGFHVRAFEASAVDTTGAGDAFIGSFAAFLAEGREERESVERACLYAALSTQKVGTQKSFPKRKAFERAWKEALRKRKTARSSRANRAASRSS